MYCIIVFINNIIALPPIGERSIVMSVSVCVCLFVCPRSYPIRPTFLCMLTMDVARSYFGSIVIRYVLPVLWMTPSLLISQGCWT